MGRCSCGYCIIFGIIYGVFLFCLGLLIIIIRLFYDGMLSERVCVGGLLYRLCIYTVHIYFFESIRLFPEGIGAPLVFAWNNTICVHLLCLPPTLTT